MKIRKNGLIFLAAALLGCVGCSAGPAEKGTMGKEPRKENKEVQGKKQEEAVPANPEKAIEEEVNRLLEHMTLEEKAAQLFVILPEALEDKEIPVGGFLYRRNHLQSKEQVQTMLSNVQADSMERIGLPAFLCVDEEGGEVARISGNENFDVPAIEKMSAIGASGDVEKAHTVGSEIGEYLSEMGFNVDFAPVADVLTNPDNTVVKYRSFGSDPQVVSEMSQAVLNGLQEKSVYGTYKHFPGHGATAGDTHAGYAYTNKSLDELKSCEWIPFQDGINRGVSLVMVGHISLPNVTGDNTPASLSGRVIQEILRGQMGYRGIVITDAMNMGAIAKQYSSEEAAVKALQAGADIILMPENFKRAYQGVLEAVGNGNLSEERIDESLKRILHLKIQMKN